MRHSYDHILRPAPLDANWGTAAVTAIWHAIWTEGPEIGDLDLADPRRRMLWVPRRACSRRRRQRRTPPSERILAYVRGSLAGGWSLETSTPPRPLAPDRALVARGRDVPQRFGDGEVSAQVPWPSHRSPRRGDEVAESGRPAVIGTPDRRRSSEPVRSCSRNRARPGRRRTPRHPLASAPGRARCRRRTSCSSRRSRRR